MNEIKTIGDLKEAGLLRGFYSGLVAYYIDCHRRQFPKVYFINHKRCETEYYTVGTFVDYKSLMERYLCNEPIGYLEKIDFSRIRHFGHGKKEAQMKIIFDNLGLDWLKEVE